MKRQDFERGSAGLRLAVGLMAAFILTGVIVYSCGWFDEAAQVTQEEFGPRAMLKKYEWFKDTSAQLEQKRANIDVYEVRVKSMDDSYKSLPRQQWPRDDREQYNVWMSEEAGLKASYNQLAAEYNSQMAKVNWRFANAGELPKGADVPLPREYKPYITQ